MPGQGARPDTHCGIVMAIALAVSVITLRRAFEAPVILFNSCHQVCGCYGSSRTWLLTWWSRFVIDPVRHEKSWLWECKI